MLALVTLLVTFASAAPVRSGYSAAEPVVALAGDFSFLRADVEMHAKALPWSAGGAAEALGLSRGVAAADTLEGEVKRFMLAVAARPRYIADNGAALTAALGNVSYQRLDMHARIMENSPTLGGALSEFRRSLDVSDGFHVAALRQRLGQLYDGAVREGVEAGTVKDGRDAFAARRRFEEEEKGPAKLYKLDAFRPKKK